MKKTQRKRKTTDALIKKIQDLMNEGYMKSAIARKLKKSKALIGWYIKTYNLTYPKSIDGYRK